MSEERVSHRTLVRIESVEDGGRVFVWVPAWNPHEVVEISGQAIPEFVLTGFGDGQTRFYTKVNIGCEDSSGLYFDDQCWECGE